MSDELLREIVQKANRDEQFRMVLIDAQQNHTLVEVYANPQDLDQGTVGFVLSVGHDTCRVQEIDAEGMPDGATTISLRDVRQIAWNTRFLCRLQVIFDNRASFFDTAEDLDEDSEDEGPVLDDVLQELNHALIHRYMISVRIATDHDYRHANGYVRRVTGGYLELDRVDRYGESDGKSLIRIKDVVMIYRNDRRQQMAMLWRERRKDLYKDAEHFRD
ncbi:MAG: hypothetical protein IT368_13635 [Candidatus Hydrogenedentes bacterium]|nr:hypothetical protein [Candidatus Hydrogenedentota bacterium]